MHYSARNPRMHTMYMYINKTYMKFVERPLLTNLHNFLHAWYCFTVAPVFRCILAHCIVELHVCYWVVWRATWLHACYCTNHFSWNLLTTWYVTVRVLLLPMNVLVSCSLRLWEAGMKGRNLRPIILFKRLQGTMYMYVCNYYADHC